MGASAQVVSWLKEGVPLPLKTPLLAKYYGGNKISKREEIEWTDREIARLVETGALVQVKEQDLTAVSPMRLVPKKSSSKFRMIVNMRGVNQHLPELHFRMEGLGTIMELLRPGDWMIKWDLKEGYFHVSLGEQASNLCGIEWAGKYYRYTVLPFGCSLSPISFTKVMREVVADARRRGIRMVAYLDDFIVLFGSAEEARKLRDEYLLPLLQKLGLVLEYSKSTLEPVQRVEMLGLVIDSEKQVIEVPEDKVGVIVQLAKTLSAKEFVSARYLASVAGKVTSIARAFPYAKVVTRAFYQLIDAADRKVYEWDAMVPVSSEVRQDAAWLAENLPVRRGAAIWKPAKVTQIFSDASGTGWGAHLGEATAGGHWKEDEAALHINTKELLGVEKALRTFKDQLQGKRVVSMTDSMTAKAYVEHAGGPDLLRTQIARRIWALAVEMDILLSSEWLPGSANEIADKESRVQPRDDWMVKRETFRFIDGKWGQHDVDRFADDLNAQTRCFNSRRGCPGSAGVDAFGQDWAGSLSWACPPLALVGRTLRHIAECGAKATVVVPHWQAQPWWPLLLSLAKEWYPLHRDDFVAGPSKFIEPHKNDAWTFWAVRI